MRAGGTGHGAEGGGGGGEEVVGVEMRYICAHVYRRSMVKSTCKLALPQGQGLRGPK